MTSRTRILSFLWPILLFSALTVQAAPNRSTFVLDPHAQVRFNYSETFIPPEFLPAVVSNPVSLTPEERARRASAVAVTRNGELYRATLTPEDIKIFERGLAAISASQQLTGSKGSAVLEAPARPDRGLSPMTGRSVIGADERIQVTPTTYWPWVTMGRIELGCTGTIVGPRHVITAGHCVYDTTTDSWYYNLNFSPAQDGSYYPFGTVAWSVAITTTGWTVNHDRNYDYAMIVLNDTIGYTTGYMSYGYDNNLCSNCIVNINGYPVDKPFGTMWHEDCPLTGVQTSRLYYECDTFNGMSGSSVYMYWASSGNRIIYGIHAYGVDHTGDNSGTRINSSVFNNFNSWREQYPPAY